MPEGSFEERVGRVHAFDAAIEKRIEPFRNAAFDRFFYSLSSAADHGLIWGALAGVRAPCGATTPRWWRGSRPR